MSWTKKQIEQHILAVKKLVVIKDEFFSFLKPGISEYEAMEFVRKQYKERGLWSDHEPIVAFGQNTSFVHYFPSQYCRKLCPGSLILLDIWVRAREVGAPFADMTWMGICGKNLPSDAEKVFRLVLLARDRSVRFLRKKVAHGVLPKGREVDAVARGVFEKAGYGKYFLHSLGHPLGFKNPHGVGVRLSSKKGEGVLERRVGYTIEPGIYLQNKFGVRSEINFYIEGGEVIITTPAQKKITRI